MAGNRIASVDGLRAIALGLVLGAHAAPQVMPSGGVGVDLFFVISGFVITRHLYEEKPAFRRFFLNRILRLWPASMLVLGFVVLLLWAGYDYATPTGLIASLTGWMNWARAFDMVPGYGGRLGHYWSLGVEEQFYLIWPALLALVLAGRRNPVVLLLAIIAAVTVWRVVLFFDGASGMRIYNGLDTRADALAIGCLLYFVKWRASIILGVAALAGLLVLALIPAELGSAYDLARYSIVGGLSFIAVGAAASGGGMRNSLLAAAPVHWMGRRSYAIYLWHYPVIGLASAIGVAAGVRGAVYVGAAIIVSLVAAELTYRLVERPIDRWRHSRLG
ncbi:acyltransferase 3 [Altererythrobacter epoxidivorans]|uniref:Acyltransferase 3 n=1 Tax=Altererythrobacter epoxidivorans TaxID=361183 RepID=A0A0M4MTL0_9SPHN|nr:acyltransferase [Altererythrobacter epoxidivorans]ALE15488.1 acyltransferase 3 [Altererythrobacter epoxidivorans]